MNFNRLKKLFTLVWIGFIINKVIERSRKNMCQSKTIKYFKISNTVLINEYAWANESLCNLHKIDMKSQKLKIKRYLNQ